MSNGESLASLVAVFVAALPAAQEETSSTGEEVALEATRIEVGELVFEARAAGPEDGELVLLLHGFPQTSYSFRHQIRALAAAGYRSVAPDQRGYSPGARPLSDAEYAMPHLVGDVLGIADALGRSQFHLVGHDWGGAVAWAVAARFPDRVLSLTVCSTPHFGALGESWSDPESEQTRRSGYMQGFRAEGAELSFLEDDAARLRAIFRGAGLSAEDVQVYVDVLGTPDAMRAALAWYRAMGSASPTNSTETPAGPTPASAPSSARPSAGRIQPRTLYVWSTADPAFARAPAERTADFVDGPYRFEVLEGVGHWIPEEAADRLNELLLEHVAGTAR